MCALLSAPKKRLANQEGILNAVNSLTARALGSSAGGAQCALPSRSQLVWLPGTSPSSASWLSPQHTGGPRFHMGLLPHSHNPEAQNAKGPRSRLCFPIQNQLHKCFGGKPRHGRIFQGHPRTSGCETFGTRFLSWALISRGCRAWL